MAKWWEDLYTAGKDYLKERYLGGDASSAANILKDATGAYTAYKSYEDQKRANEALESAYREYTQDKERSQETIDAALALGLSPMTVSGVPTTKAEITDFTEVQDVAKGGIISLPNKKRKKYLSGSDKDDFEVEEMDDEIITPFDLKNEEGVPIGPMVERIKELKIKVQDGTITEEETIELRNLESKAVFQMAKGSFNNPPYKPTQETQDAAIQSLMAKGDPTEWLEQDTMPNWFDLMREEGVDYGEQVKKDPQLVKPPWMTQEEFLNFQYGRNQAARGGIMNLRNGGRPGFESGTDPTKYKFWELVDTEYEDKKSQEKEDAINADMEAGISWDEIKKKYNLKDFEDVSIKETEREETDSGNKVKEIFETIKEKVGSISFAKGGRTGYKLGVGPVDPEEPPIYLPDPNEESEDLAYLTGEGTWGIDRAKRIWEILPDDIQDGYKGFQDFFESTDWHGIKMKKGGRVKRDNGGIMNLGGMEKDYRFSGGFVPIGEYEKKMMSQQDYLRTNL